MAFLPLLTVLFIGLKLTGYIGWAWFWVLFPLQVHFGVILFWAIIVLFFKANNKRW